MICGNRLDLRVACLALLFLAFSSVECAHAQARRTAPVSLDRDWYLQSSAKVHASGDVLSSSSYRARGWMPVTVPTTVVAAMVNAKVYPDPTFGTNLRDLPGMDYAVGKNYSKTAMPPSSPFAVSWWYRKQFRLPVEGRGRHVELHFEGINYRANIWVNGQRIADTTTAAGAWRQYAFDVTKLVTATAANVVAVEVFAPTETDLAITFVDWNPMPPDKDMGLFRKVFLTMSGPVKLSNPAVFSQVTSPANDQAQLSITAQATNTTDQAVEGVLRGGVGDIRFEQHVSLAPGEIKDVDFEAADYPQLRMSHPRLWWPAQMGSPHLYPLRMRFEIAGKLSDATDTRIGIRQITSEVSSQTRRLFRINGKPLLIRGGGWTTDFMLRENSRRLNEELNYVQDMGLNTIRLEGRPETDGFYEETDRRGILVMAGWSCCDFWEQWPKWTPETHAIAVESLRSQMYRLRGHASLLAWLNGSDNQPPPEQEQVYLDMEKKLRWPNPIFSSATAKLGTGGAQNGARMTGPYDYVPPTYWLADNEENQPGHDCNLGGCGGAHGFNTETSAGPAIPPIESLRRMLGDSHLWPIDDTWRFHAGGGPFRELDNYTHALDARYGAAHDAEDYAKKSQLMAYEGTRAMFESYSRNKYESTGVIQWMLNNAWPSVIWHLYDYYLRAGGGYFGAKLAMQPLHPLYSSIDRSVWVVSSQYKDAAGLKLEAKVYNLDMTEKFSRSIALDAGADSTQKVFTLPEIQGLSPVYFLKLKLTGRTGVLAGSNFYWLSTTPETIDWGKSNWYTTPSLTLSDYTALSQLPKVHLTVSRNTERAGDRSVTHVRVSNPGDVLAFAIRLKLNKGARGEEILPAIWEDNYFSLLPHESRDVAVSYAAGGFGPENITVQANGWNTK
jgi:exo-1,4-beta-D-glucosaminidase